MQQAVELSQEGALWTGGIERSLPAAAGAAKKLRYEFRYDSQSQPVSSDRNASQESRAPEMRNPAPDAAIRAMKVVAVGGLEPPARGL
jgi:hypothetical protein